MKQILAIIVLYRMRAEESPAFVSLAAELARTPHAAQAMELMLFDNTPWEQDAPAGFQGVYWRDTSNAGLAAAYQAALDRASTDGLPWLLLLDQDTTVTSAYLDEMLAAVDLLRTEDEPGAEPMAGAQGEIAAIVPRLASHGVQCSPLRVQVLGPARPVEETVPGVAPRGTIAFNSGALLRVSALRAMGGFPRDFPIDYLDYVVFTMLQARGYGVQILASTLEHELSSNTERSDEAAIVRHRSALDAERRYFERFGSAGDRLLRRLRLLKAAAGRIVRRKESGYTLRLIRSALRP
jgi:GT2 family glycosyltransferase